MNFRKFPSKIILFGEYTIIQGSHALAVPHPLHSGRLRLPHNESTSEAIQSNGVLKKLATYLDPLVKKESIIIDNETFKRDIQKGLIFDSNIPSGYGLGSSGALSAAVYQHYSETFPNNLEEIKNQLALIESFFHGNSSGIDPLVSFCNKALFISKHQIEPIDAVITKDSNIRCFLIDSGKARKTESMLDWYKHEIQDQTFNTLLVNTLIPSVQLAISALLENEEEQFFEQLKIVSTIQLNYFKPMILPEHIPIWQNGLESNLYTLKLCGAGGGGYMLGFSKSYECIKGLFPFIPLPNLPYHLN